MVVFIRTAYIFFWQCLLTAIRIVSPIKRALSWYFSTGWRGSMVCPFSRELRFEDHNLMSGLGKFSGYRFMLWFCRPLVDTLALWTTKIPERHSSRSYLGSLHYHSEHEGFRLFQEKSLNEQELYAWLLDYRRRVSLIYSHFMNVKISHRCLLT